MEFLVELLVEAIGEGLGHCFRHIVGKMFSRHKPRVPPLDTPRPSPISGVHYGRIEKLDSKSPQFNRMNTSRKIF